jgi:SAM-dependent methyltransferase
MLKRIISKILRTQPFPKLLIRPILKLHGFCYSVAGSMAVQLEGGVHPKHRIMRYKEWFLDNINKDDVILDVGCNTGMMPEVMSQKAAFVYGIEIEPENISEAKAKRQKNNIEFICADATTYDYTNCRSISCVTLSNVLEHIEHRVDFLKNLIKQITWHDEANKKLLIRVPMIDREWITVYKNELGIDYRLDPTHYTEYTYAQFKQELSECGIGILSYHVKFGEIYAVCNTG